MVQLDRHARRLMACLGDASRFRLAQALMEGEVCVTDLARRVKLSQSCTTRHLQALGRDGLVLRRRDGKRVLYRLNVSDWQLRALLDWAAGGAGLPVPAERETASDEVASPHPGPGQRGASKRAKKSRAAAPDPALIPEEEEAPAAPARHRGDIEDYLL